jgi:hypothetical protein
MKLKILRLLFAGTAVSSVLVLSSWAFPQTSPTVDGAGGCTDQLAELAGKLAKLKEPDQELTGLGLLAKAPLAQLEAEQAADQAAMLTRAKMKGKSYEECRLALVHTRAKWLCPSPRRRETSFLGRFDKKKSDEAWEKTNSCQDAYYGSLTPEDSRLVEASKNTPEALFSRCKSYHYFLTQGKEVSKDGASVCANLDDQKRADAEEQGKAEAAKTAALFESIEKTKVKIRDLRRADELLRNHPDCLVPSSSFGCAHWRAPWRRDKVTLAIERCTDEGGRSRLGCVVDKLAEAESSNSDADAKTEAAKIEAMRNHPDCLQPTEWGCRRWREPKRELAK